MLSIRPNVCDNCHTFIYTTLLRDVLLATVVILEYFYKMFEAI